MKKLSEYTLNDSNPRFISQDKLERLKKSINDFPKMMSVRPIVVDDNNVVLGGNMRFRALQELGYTEVQDTWIQKIDDLTEEQKQEFIIKDNVGFGTWDWDILANEWDNDQLVDWGMDVWQTEQIVDYSILDNEDLNNELSNMIEGVKKAIQIEFNHDHYQEAADLVKFWRNQGAYLGGMIIEHLKNEKNKIKS